MRAMRPRSATPLAPTIGPRRREVRAFDRAQKLRGGLPGLVRSDQDGEERQITRALHGHPDGVQDEEEQCQRLVDRAEQL